jgi:hypothetical protein
MSRLLPFAVLAASIAHAAPVPKGTDETYFPTREGDTRVYEIRVGDKVEGRYTDVVTKVEKKDGAIHVTLTRDFPGSAQYVSTVAVSSEGLFRVAYEGKVMEKPVPLLKLPAKEGTKWEVDEIGQYTIKNEEEVEVPAGKFRAVRVELVKGDHKTTLWFAPTVGQIKQVSTMDDQVRVLKELKRGK